MKRLFLFCIAFFMTFSGATLAGVEKGYQSGKPRVVTPWYAPSDASSVAADLTFIKGMRPHHAGALTMSEGYLKDSAAVNGPLKKLARGIIRNQEFEIGMLDTVELYAKARPHGDSGVKQVAADGLAQRDRFVRSPMPGFLDRLAGPTAVSYRDVQFAKAMIIHHQAALDMARDYLARPAATNGYLRLMCLDILVDQEQEIDFMQGVIAEYPGNPDAVKIDASMIHGMDGMRHGHKPAPVKKKPADHHGVHH